MKRDDVVPLPDSLLARVHGGASTWLLEKTPFIERLRAEREAEEAQRKSKRASYTYLLARAQKARSELLEVVQEGVPAQPINTGNGLDAMVVLKRCIAVERMNAFMRTNRLLCRAAMELIEAEDMTEDQAQALVDEVAL